MLKSNLYHLSNFKEHVTLNNKMLLIKRNKIIRQKINIQSSFKEQQTFQPPIVQENLESKPPVVQENLESKPLVVQENLESKQPVVKETKKNKIHSVGKIVGIGKISKIQ